MNSKTHTYDYTILTLIPAGVGGVCDYAHIVAGELRSGLINVATSDDVNELLYQAKAGDVLLLHFSGYGYQKRGLPFFLISAVKKFRAKNIRVVVVFHELYATDSRPWKSAFWLSGLQKYISRRLATLSDAAYTNRKSSCDWLSQFVPGEHLDWLPVFSNVGELQTLEAKRENVVVIFGSSSLREKIYKRLNNSLFEFAKKNGLRVLDVGPEIVDNSVKTLFRINADVIEQLGRLDVSELSDVLSRALIGGVVYHLDYVTKSGVIAAYCAYGVVPLVVTDSANDRANRKENELFLSSVDDVAKLSSFDLSLLSENAYEWYQDHNIEMAASKLKDLVTNVAHA